MSIQILINSKLNSEGLRDTEFRLLSVKQILKSMESVGPTELLKFDADQFTPFAEQGTRAITEQITLLKQYSQTLQQAAQGAQALGNDVASGAFQKRKVAIDAEIKSLQSLIPVEQQAALMAEKYAQATDFSTVAVEKQVAALKKQQATLLAASKNEFARGNIEQANALKSLSDQVGRTADSFSTLKGEQEKVDIATRIMNSSFNKLGFTLFITISTLQQIAGMMQAVWTAAEEGAAIADRYESFNQNLAAVGISAGDMAQRLNEASQGAVKMDTAMQGVLRLLKADLPTMANQADVLLEIATNAAIVEGDLADVNRIYETLITGIIRGEPRLIDNAGIILKVGQSVDAYAASLGKTAEQLTESERAQAVFNAVVDRADSIQAMAENLDSASLALQQYKTDVANATDVLKAFFGTLAGDALAAARENQEGMVAAFLKSVGAMDSSSQSAERLAGALESLRGLMVALTGGAIGVITLFRGIGAVIDDAKKAFGEFFLAIANGYSELIATIMSGGDVSEVLKQQANNIQDAAKGAFTDPIEGLKQAARDSVQAMDDWEARFMGSNDAAINKIEEIPPALKKLSSELDVISDKMEMAFDPLSDQNIARDLADKRADIEADFSDKMTDIREQLAEKLSKIEEDLGTKLSDLLQDRNDKILRITQDYAEKQTEINEDLADKLSDIAQDARDKEANAREDAAQKLEDAEEDHQRKLNDIQRKYELARLSALIDRDARALFEAEQNRKSDLADAEETAKDKKEEVVKQLEEQLKDIAKAEERARDDAEKAAERRREDAIKQLERQRRDAEKAYQRARQDAIKAAEDQRRDAIQASDKARRDALNAYRDRLDDLNDWYNEQLLRQKEAELKRLLARAEEYEKEGKLTQEHINELNRMWSDYEKDRNAESATPAPITYNPSPGGGIGGGGGVSVPGGVTNPSSGSGTGGSQGGAMNGGSYLQNSQYQRVNINVTNDRTLNQIFKEISYEATMEIIQP